MEITKGEVIASISIISIMLIIGFILSGSISDDIADKNLEYNKALRVEQQEIFEYGMNTNVGNAFVYGDYEAIDAVSYPEVEGDYLYIEKVKEEYTMKTRTVTHTDSKGKSYTTVETYWEWDRVGSEDKRSEEIKFLGVKFGYWKFLKSYASYIDTINESSDIRYKFYGTPATGTGTIYTTLQDGTIGNDIRIINGTIDEAYDELTSGIGLWFFWIAWIILIMFVIYGFYYLENQWLD